MFKMRRRGPLPKTTAFRPAERKNFGPCFYCNEDVYSYVQFWALKDGVNVPVHDGCKWEVDNPLHDMKKLIEEAKEGEGEIMVTERPASET